MWKYLVFLFVLTSLLLQSCNNPFAPAQADNIENQPPLLTNQETPDEVLINFRFAYTFKDSLVYSELFDSTFTFVSWNFNVSPAEPINWGRDQELKVAGRMFGLINTLDVIFNVINRDTIRVDTANVPAEIEHRITFTLTLNGGAIPSLTILNGEVVFLYLRREKKWFISRWVDQQI